MKNAIGIFGLFMFLLSSLQPASAVPLKQATGALLAASDGQGDVQLLWLSPAGRWPVGGWRLEEAGSGRVIEAQIKPGEAQAMQNLSVQDAAGVAKLGDALAKAGNPKSMQLIYGLLEVRAASDWHYARALGLAETLRNIASGKRQYRVVGIDAQGKASGVALVSQPVDAGVATALPPPPAGGRAESVSRGVALYWDPAPASRVVPVISYFVARDGGGQNNTSITPAALIRGISWSKVLPALVDANAPLETALVYRIYSVDLFGRRSLPVEVKFFAADVRALAPPEHVNVMAGSGMVALKWQASSNPHTAGYLVERAYLYAGPYEVLTAQGLPPGSGAYTDHNVRGGTTYYYRVHAVGPRGDLGPASAAVMAQPQSTDNMPVPQGVKADTGRTRVQLTWQPVSIPVAGYIVERSEQGTKTWLRLDEKLVLETRYEDYFGLGREGGFTYRVTAVGFDNRKSDPSAAVSVTLPETTPPPLPRISSISGAGAKVELEFLPGQPAAKTRQFIVMRSSSPRDPGMVIGDLLAADARHFDDTLVVAGKDYWYRIVAVDQADNRSAPSAARVVTVQNAAIPQAGKPQVRMLDKPFRQVEIDFDQPPPGLGVMVQSRAGDTRPWVLLAGPVSGTGKAYDANLPDTGKIQYRIVYQAANGVQGQPSESVSMDLP